MMNITTATVHPGESLAVFPITVPRPAGILSSNQLCRGKVRQISYTSTGVREIPYEVYAWLTQGSNNTYPFVLKTEIAERNKPPAMASRLQRHFDAADAAFPMVHNVPRLTYDDGEYPHWQLDLPARSCFYSSDETFFVGLGFGFSDGFKPGVRQMGGRGRALTSKDVFGFFNYSTLPISILGAEMFPGTSLNANLPRGTEVPDNMQLQIELMDWGRQTITLPFLENATQPATKENAVRLLGLQMERVAAAFTLTENPIKVLAGTGDVVKLKNQEYEDNITVSLQLELNEAMAEAYGLGPGQIFVFPLNASHSYDLIVRDRKDDPFEGLYPIVMRSTSSGQPISYVEGVGHTTVFAYLNEKSDRHPVITDGLTFETDRSFVTFQFLDRNKEIVVFKDGHRIEMLMMFQFL